MARVVKPKLSEEDEFRRLVGLIPSYFYLNDQGETAYSRQNSGTIHPLLASYCQVNPEIADFELREGVRKSINFCLKNEKFDLSFFLEFLNENLSSEISSPKIAYRAVCRINSCRSDLGSRETYKAKFHDFNISLYKYLPQRLRNLNFDTYRENFIYPEVNSGGYIIISGNFRNFDFAGDKLTESAENFSSYLNFTKLKRLYLDYRMPKRQKAPLKFGPNWYVCQAGNRKFTDSIWTNGGFQPEFWDIGPVGWNEIEVMMARVKPLLKRISTHYIKKRINSAILHLGESWRATSTQDRAIAIWKSVESLLSRKNDSFDTIYKRASKFVIYDEKFRNELKFVSQWRNHSVHAHTEKPFTEHVERIFESITHSVFYIIDMIFFLDKIRNENEYFYFLDIAMNENEILKAIRINQIAYDFIKRRSDS